MAEYRDPKVTTATDTKSGAGKWIGIALAVLLAILLLAWLMGSFDSADETETVPVVNGETTDTPPAAGAAPEPAN